MKPLFYILALCIFTLAILASGCTSVRIQQTLKEYRVIIKPSNNLRPHTYEAGDGETQVLEAMPTEGNTMMIVVRGKL